MPRPKHSHPAPRNTVQGARVLGRITGRQAVFYSSRKAGGILALESASERVIAQLAELDPRVKSISPQPFALDVITGKVFKTRRELEDARMTRSKIDAARRDYTPDLLLVLHDGTRLIVEVKDPRHLPRDEYREKLETARRMITMRGERFLLIPLQYDETAPLVRNAELLAQALFTPPSSNLIRAVSEKVAALRADTPAALRDLVPALGLTLRDVPALITTGVLEADLAGRVLDGRTLVGAAHGSLSHLELLPLDEFTT